MSKKKDKSTEKQSNVRTSTLEKNYRVELIVLEIGKGIISTNRLIDFCCQNWAVSSTTAHNYIKAARSGIKRLSNVTTEKVVQSYILKKNTLYELAVKSGKLFLANKIATELQDYMQQIAGDNLENGETPVAEKQPVISIEIKNSALPVISEDEIKDV